MCFRWEVSLLSRSLWAVACTERALCHSLTISWFPGYEQRSDDALSCKLRNMTVRLPPQHDQVVREVLLHQDGHHLEYLSARGRAKLLTVCLLYSKCFWATPKRVINTLHNLLQLCSVETRTPHWDGRSVHNNLRLSVFHPV